MSIVSRRASSLWGFGLKVDAQILHSFAVAHLPSLTAGGRDTGAAADVIVGNKCRVLLVDNPALCAPYSVPFDQCFVTPITRDHRQDLLSPYSAIKVPSLSSHIEELEALIVVLKQQMVIANPYTRYAKLYTTVLCTESIINRLKTLI